MSKKDSSTAFNKLLGNHKDAKEVTAAEVTKKESVKKVVADPQPKKKKGKEEEGKDYLNFSTRLSVEEYNYIQDYSYTHRISVRQALEKILDEHKAAYEADKKNAPLLKKFED